MGMLENSDALEMISIRARNLVFAWSDIEKSSGNDTFLKRKLMEDKVIDEQYAFSKLNNKDKKLAYQW